MLFSFSRIKATSLTSLSSNPSLWKFALWYLIYLCIFLLCYNLYIYVYSDLVHHYCVSNVLERIKTVYKIWWYKQLFFKLYFWAKYDLKPKMYIVIIWLSSYSSFFFLFTFNVFLLSVFFFSSFSALHPITKKTMILSKYYSNRR